MTPRPWRRRRSPSPAPDLPANVGGALTEAERAVHDQLMADLAAPLTAPLADTGLLASALSDGDAATSGLTGDLRASVSVSPSGAIVQEATR